MSWRDPLTPYLAAAPERAAAEAAIDRALVHRSWTARHPTEGHNEVLEFLGDAVLKLMMTELLVSRYPGIPEGRLTSFRQTLENDEHLAVVARRIGLRPRTEPASVADDHSVAAGALEAMLGAVWTTLGVEAARAAFASAFAVDLPPELPDDPDAHKAPWNRLQELLQRDLKLPPPVVLDERQSGGDHDGVWTVDILAGGRTFTGIGNKKQHAKASAAEIAVAALLADPPTSPARSPEPDIDPMARLNAMGQAGASVRWAGEVQADPPSGPWSVTLDIGVQGLEARFTGEGANKREARRDAAARAVAWHDRQDPLR